MPRWRGVHALGLCFLRNPPLFRGRPMGLTKAVCCPRCRGHLPFRNLRGGWSSSTGGGTSDLCLFESDCSSAQAGALALRLGLRCCLGHSWCSGLWSGRLGMETLIRGAATVRAGVGLWRRTEVRDGSDSVMLLVRCGSELEVTFLTKWQQVGLRYLLQLPKELALGDATWSGGGCGGWHCAPRTRNRMWQLTVN